MSAVIFDITFSNGIGSAEVLIVKGGKPVDDFKFSQTGHHVSDLPPGFYIVTLTGNSQGAEFLISEPSTPSTPDNFNAGVIAKGYVLNIKNP